VSAHSTGFREFLLKAELLKAIGDCGFEHPSEVQHECIPQAILGTDVVCQAKSGMGKTAVFVIATLQQLVPVDGQVSVLVVTHARELAFQIAKEFERFSKHLTPAVRVANFFGGLSFAEDQKKITDSSPHIVVGTPGRLLALIKAGNLKLGNVKHFVIDECDRVLEKTDMRNDVQQIFFKTPRQKQVLMFSATLPKEIRPVCKKFMHTPLEVYIDDETKMTLHGLKQHYVNLVDKEKNRKLFTLLDALDFNQVVIFVSNSPRADALNKLLTQNGFPSITIHHGLKQELRMKNFSEFKAFSKRILVTTDLFGRGVDVERVNIVINYDMPATSDAYLHRVARAGRFGTKGLAVTFVSDEKEAAVLNDVQARFEVSITELPEKLDKTSYMEE